MAKTYKYWINSGTTMFGISSSEFARRVRSMYDLWSSFCDVRFERSSTRGGTKFQYWGVTHEQMMARLGKSALGFAWNNGTIWVLASERRGLDLNKPWNWYVENLAAHETGHVLGLDHSDERDKYTEAVMHSNATSEFWTRREVEYWQDRFGPPKYKWVPNDRRMYGYMIAETQAMRKFHKAQRDDAINTVPRGSLSFADWVHKIKEKRTYHQGENLRYLRQEIQYSQAWFFLKDYWDGTPGVV